MNNQFSMILYYFKRRLEEKLTEKEELESSIQDKTKQVENLRDSLEAISREIDVLKTDKDKFVQNNRNRRTVRWSFPLYLTILVFLIYSLVNMNGYRGIASLGVAITSFLVVTLYKINKTLKKERKQLEEQYGEDETLEKIEQHLRTKEKEREKNEELMQIGIQARIGLETDLNLVKLSIDTLEQKMELTKDAFFVDMHSEYVASDILPLEGLKSAFLVADAREERKRNDILTRVRPENK